MYPTRDRAIPVRRRCHHGRRRHTAQQTFFVCILPPFFVCFVFSPHIALLVPLPPFRDSHLGAHSGPSCSLSTAVRAVSSVAGKSSAFSSLVRSCRIVWEGILNGFTHRLQFPNTRYPGTMIRKIRTFCTLIFSLNVVHIELRSKVHD